MKNTGLLSLAFILFTFSWLSCETDKSCDDSTESILRAEFFRKTLEDNIYKEDILKIDSLVVFPLLKPEDSLYKFANGIGEIQLQLDPFSGSTSFALRADTIQDTIHFNHSSELMLVSVNCGFTHYYYLSDITHTSNAIDSIQVNDTIIDVYERQNIKIYFR